MASAATALPIWAQWVQAIGSPLAALIFGATAVWITFNQLKTAREKLNADLFEKRFLIFQKCNQFSAAIIQEGNLNYESLPDFYNAKGQAQFLFDVDVNDFLKETKERAFRIKNSYAEIYDSNGQAIDHPDRSRCRVGPHPSRGV